MDEIFNRIWTDLVMRVQGPLWFRLILQPLIACVFGVRAGLRNAQQQTPPTHLLDTEYRRKMFRQGWSDVGKVLLIGVLLDVIFQWIALRTLYPGEALFVAILLVVVPYQIIRTLVARFARKA